MKNLHILIVLCASLAISTVSYGLRFNVKSYGALGNGATDDTVAIRNAINAANNAEGTNTVYFPSGTYLVYDIPITTEAGHGATKLDSNPTDLIFTGDGAYSSVLKRKPGGTPQTSRIATIQSGSNLIFQNLGFDANAIERFGGIATYSSTNIIVQKVRCFDSNPVQPMNGYDRYMFVFNGNDGVWVQDCLWEDLQLELDNSNKIRVLRNSIYRGRETANIGCWAVNDGWVATDYIINDNWVIDPTLANTAIIIQLDNSNIHNGIFRNFTVKNNTIIYSSPPAGPERPSAIKFGTCDSSGAPIGSIFDQIDVTGNKIYVDPGVSDTFDWGFVWFWSTSPTQYFKFDNTTATNNTLYYNGSQPCLDVRSSAKGVNWYDANNIKNPYTAPPAVPNPVIAREVLSNGIFNWNLNDWIVQNAVYDAASSPFALALPNGSAKFEGTANIEQVLKDYQGNTLASNAGYSTGTATFSFDFYLTETPTVNSWSVQLISSDASLPVRLGIGSRFLVKDAQVGSDLVGQTWYNATVSIDFDTQTYSGVVKSYDNDSGVVVGTWAPTALEGTIKNIRKVRFQNSDPSPTTIYIDSVSMSMIVKSPERLLNGPIKSNLDGWTAGVTAAESVTYDSSKFSPFATTAGSVKFTDVAAIGAETPKMEQLVTDEQLIPFPAGMGINAGPVIFSFDFYLASTPTANSWRINLFDGVRLGIGPQFILKDSPIGSNLVGGVWYNVTVDVNLDLQTYSGEVKSWNGGNPVVVASWTATAMESPAGNLRSVKIQDYSSAELSTTVNIDNILVSVPADQFSNDVIGAVILGDYDPVDPTVPVCVKIDLKQDGNLVRSEQQILGPDKDFKLQNVSAGDYTLSLKACSWLKKTIPITKTSYTLNLEPIELINGDLHGDNEVFFTSLSIVLSKFGSMGDEP